MFEALANKPCFTLDYKKRRYDFVGYNNTRAGFSFRDAVIHNCFGSGNITINFPTESEHLFKVYTRLINEMSLSE